VRQRIPSEAAILDAAGMSHPQLSGAAEKLLSLLATGLAAFLGGSVALACGCAADHGAALWAGVLALAGHLVVRERRDAAATVDSRRRDRADVAAMVVGGAGVLLAARSGPGLVGAGIAAGVLGWLASRSNPAPGPTAQALMAAVCLWWVVTGTDQAHRHSLSAMGALIGVGPALLLASARLHASRGVGGRGIAALTAVCGQAWTAGWWWAEWLPTAAVWALPSAVVSLAALLCLHLHRNTAGRWLAWGAALLHIGLLAASLWQVVALR